MKTNFLSRNALPRGADVFLRLGLILITLFSFNVIGYGQTPIYNGTPSIETCLTGKHLKRTSPNLLDGFIDGTFPDPEGDDTHNWWHIKDGCWGVDNPAISPYQLWTDEDSYDAGTGCMKLSGPRTPSNTYVHTRTCEVVIPEGGYDSDGNPIWGSGQNNQSNATNDRILLRNVPIEGDKTHTISVRCKTEDECHSPVMLIQLQSDHPTNGQRNFTFSTAEAGVWEEFSFTFTMPQGVTKMRIEIANYRRETDADMDMVAYIDNLYLGEGVSFEDPPSCKKPFNGEAVKVDELGNVYVKNAQDAWEWFFPFILHGSNHRVINDPIYTDNGWKRYAEQGFNAIVTGNADYFIDDAIDAGLRVVPHLGFYYAHSTPAPLSALTARLDHIKNTEGGMNNLLAYIIDNEVHNKWTPLKAATDKVMQWEATNVADNYYDRIAPIYMNNGHPGLAPKYLSYDDNDNKICHIGDITSSYISFDDEANSIATNWRMRTMEHSNNQIMPTNISQINGNHLFRARIYGSIAEGARGMDYWRDFAPGHIDHIPNCYDDSGNPIPNCPDPTNTFHQHLFDDATDQDGDGATTGDILNNFLLNGNLRPSNDITQVEWWDDFPDLVDEIYEMKDLIQQPHWTNSWGISSCVSGSQNCYDANFVIGTRELNKRGYIIVANYGTGPVTATITTSGLPFTSAPLKDFFTNSVVTNMTNSQFQITLPYNGVGVYKIDRYLPPSSGEGVCEDDITINGNLIGPKEATQTVTTNGTTNVLSGADASLKGGFSVTLNPGFKAVYGSEFKAHIGPCENGTDCIICEGLPPTPEGFTFPKESESEAWVKHYPNPFREEVNLEFNLYTDAHTEVIITDVNGKTVTKIPSQKINRGLQMIQLSTKDWIPGIYFYQVQIKAQDTGIISHANGTLVKM